MTFLRRLRHGIRPRLRLGLFSRSFLLIAFLMLVSLGAWLQIVFNIEEGPRASQLAQRVATRVSTRRTAISAKEDHCPAARPWLLSNTSSTEARAAGLRWPEPLKITSCIEDPRSSEALVSPRTQRTASMMFDLPQPLGPTTPTSSLGVGITVGSTKDLNPASLICVSRTVLGRTKNRGA